MSGEVNLIREHASETSVQGFLKQLHSSHFQYDIKNIDFSIQVIIRFAVYKSNEYSSMILLQINAVLQIGHWYRNHNYSDFFIGVI